MAFGTAVEVIVTRLLMQLLQSVRISVSAYSAPHFGHFRMLILPCPFPYSLSAGNSLLALYRSYRAITPSIGGAEMPQSMDHPVLLVPDRKEITMKTRSYDITFWGVDAEGTVPAAALVFNNRALDAGTVPGKLTCLRLSSGADAEGTVPAAALFLTTGRKVRGQSPEG